MRHSASSYIGSVHGGEGVKLEEQLLTEHGIEPFTTYPFEPHLLAH